MKWRDFAPGLPFPATWTDGMEEGLSDHVGGNFKLTKASDTAVQVVAGPGDAQAGIFIDGKPRWATATKTGAVQGTPAAGNLDIFATCHPDVFSMDGSGHEVNNTISMEFAIVVGTPSGVGIQTHARRVGYCEWDGAKIVKVFQETGASAGTAQHAGTHEAGGSDPSTWALGVRSVLDVGQSGQTRAGRALVPSDCTDLGLSVPIGLYNLGGVADASGNGRNLTNKGTVPFGVGVDGAASSAALFSGSTAQVLYRADTGAADPFRIRTGSWGCWFRTAKRGTSQGALSKTQAATSAYFLGVDTTNVARVWASTDGATANAALGSIDVCDDRWHFVVAVFDGTALRLYVDGALDATTLFAGLIFQGTSPLNIGGSQADAATATNNPWYGRVDEAFVTPDVLTEDQVRLLYAVKLAHGAPRSPRRAGLVVRRRRRGALLVAGDFPSQPLRLYNLGGATPETDLGSNNTAFTINGPLYAGGPDGLANGAAFLASGLGGNFASTDAGLPAALTTRSYGIWFKTADVTGGNMIGWGTISTADARLATGNGGVLRVENGADGIAGPVVNDGQWHFAVVVEDNAAADGVKRKLYVDGRLVGSSLVMNSITLAGAARFRIGASPTGTGPFVGSLARAFVHNVALTAEQIMALYTKSSQDLGRSPKDAGDHVERIDATNIYFIGDTLDPQEQIELEVAA